MRKGWISSLIAVLLVTRSLFAVRSLGTIAEQVRSSIPDRIDGCARPRRGCCACCPCCRPGATGPAPSSRTGSASPPAPSATTSTGCASSATRSRRDRVWPAATGSAPAARCRRCCSTTRRRWRSRSACAPPRAARSPASRRRRCGRWPSCSRCCRRGCGTGSARFQSHALPMPSRGPQVDPDVLTVIAAACRDHERLRFDYRSHSGAAGRRSVEPYRLVNDRRRWYLVRVGRGPGRLADLPGRPDASCGPRTGRASRRVRCRPTTRSRRRWPAGSARRPGATGPG